VNGNRVQGDDQTQRARELRRKAISAEKKLWFHFKAGNKKGLKIRRQHPVGPFFIDFYCFAANLALEIDGSSHDGKHEYDQARDKFLLSKGIEVLHFPPGMADNDILEFVSWFRLECLKRIESRKQGF
jgi:very-short-patch-repair endonuclease